MAILEKTPQADLAVYVTRRQQFQTELRPLSPDECADALELGMDLFFNLDRYFPE